MRRALSTVLITVLTAGLLIAGTPASALPVIENTVRNAEPGASTFAPRAPVRVLDTRTGTGGVTGPVPARGTVTLDLTAHVPASATAVVLNLTGVAPTASTYVTVFPSGLPRPATSSLNLPPGDTRANQVTVALGADRRLSLYNDSGAIHLLADLAGHYSTSSSGAKFTALPPNRVLDTRADHTTLGPGGTRVLDLTGAVPESATAVTFNLTATVPTSTTYVVAWPTGTPRPGASHVNLPAGDTRPNLVTVALGADQKVSLYNAAGATNVIADLTGFYTPDYGAHFVPLAPKRVFDTRTDEPLGPGGRRLLDLDDELPLTSTGVALNLTGLAATTKTYVTASAPVEHLPDASTLNIAPGQAVPNAAVVAFSLGRTVSLYNDSGSVHLVADLAGVFTVLDPTPCTADCVLAWGDNGDRALGNGEIAGFSSVPKPVVTLSGVEAVSAGWGVGYALRTDGTVWAWGNNHYGQLGNGWSASESYGTSAVPVPVGSLTGVTEIVGGGDSAYALRADGTVWAWGGNHNGQLGNGTRTPSSVPVRVSGLTDVVAVGGGTANGYAVRADGTVWAWGGNNSGHLGDGSTVPFSTTPVRVSGLTGVTAVAGGSATYALRTDGTVWAWGSNLHGQLGHGQPCAPDVACVSRVPVPVSGLTGVTTIASSAFHGMALRSDDTVWAWGSNYQGKLGNGTDCRADSSVCESYVPVQVSVQASESGVTHLAAFHGGGYVLRSDGTVWAWGSNSSGALGNDSVAEYTTVPVPVQGPPGATDLASGSATGYAVVS